MAALELSPPSARRRGGLPGNRNAVKSGRHTAEMRTFRRRIHVWRCRNRKVIKVARAELAVRNALRAIEALRVQELKRGRVQSGIAGGKNLAALRARATLPVADSAARTFDDRNERGDIPAMERRLDNEIRETERERAEDVAVAAPARHLDGALHAPECLTLARLKVAVGMGGAENGIAELGTGARLERHGGAAKVELGCSVHSDEALADPGLIDDAEHRPLVFLERDERAPFVPSVDEGARTVDRIQYPAQTARALLLSELF